MSTNPVKKPMAAIAPFGLRMQPDLKERIEKAASINNRSMNAEIIARLEMSFNELAAGPAIHGLVDDQSRLIAKQAELIEKQLTLSESLIASIGNMVAGSLEQPKRELPETSDQGTRPEDLNASNDD